MSDPDGIREVPPGALAKLRRIGSTIGKPEEPLSMLGRYRLIREIAGGAMGVVYEAEDSDLRRSVALKVLRDVPGMSDVIRQRFQREAQAAGSLSHPNVVRVYDAGEAEGRLYLVMELVRGRPLSEILGQRRHETRPMLALLEKVARGLAAAHEAGIVHRDVKPANILVTEAGEPKLGDFGLAHWLDSDTALTKTGTPLGTPMYMAPEQVRGGRAGLLPATDVYALGAILYEILTGRPPHTGDTTMELYGRIMNDEPVAPRKLGAKVPRDLQTICLKALEKSAGRRYADAGKFADDLRRHLNGESILARPPDPALRAMKWAGRHRVVTVAVAMSLLGVAAVVAVVALHAAERRRSFDRLVERGRAALGEYRRLHGELAGLADLEKKLEASIDPVAGEDDKRPLWKAREEIRAKEKEAAELASLLVGAFTSALELDPRDAGLRSSLADFHVAEFERAERRGDARGMEASARMVAAFDSGAIAAKLRREGTLSLDSHPTGAEADLFRYEEGLDQRLVPKPIRPLGPCPIAPTLLPAGSYLVTLRKPGFRDVRLPVLIEHGKERAARVNLYSEEEIGPEFVYVPAGPFIMGGDPEALMSFERRPDAETGDFFMSKFEVTMGEYVDFLNHVLKTEGREAAQKRSLRTSGGGPLWIFPEGTPRVTLGPSWPADWPMMGVSWDDAVAWCRWRTGKAREAGMEVTFRLPTETEWEKAARGVDGRAFPWGDRFDYSFTKAAHPRQEGTLALDPVGTFEKDESPYGLRDMAGGVMEYCSDWFSEKAGAKAARGGGWQVNVSVAFRAATRSCLATDHCGYINGFRVVKVIER